MKIASIVGARPQFIKCALLSKELRKLHQEIIVHTGQHYDYEINEVFYNELEIPQPDYNLGVGSGTHGEQTGRMLEKVEMILIQEKPDFVLVYGDTNSTIAGALAAAKIHIKLGHVEAGLRSFDKSMPEEINRVLTDHCSNYLFCPTQIAVDNLKREEIVRDVYLTGDVMVDVLFFNSKIAERSQILDTLNLKDRQYLVATIHRASNTNNRQNMENIVDAFCELGRNLVFPLHPRTKKSLQEYGLYDKLRDKIKLIGPLGYIDFLKLLSHANKILTDSGGIQKEAYIFRVPCITLRDSTEWVETVEGGWNLLVGTDKEKIIKAAEGFNPSEEQSNIFWQGACRKISEIVSRVL
ncbi:non-hydrolyzing UDP-N-acetylglucosamine 2-epimerase [Chloroflexota bacterium]